VQQPQHQEAQDTNMAFLSKTLLMLDSNLLSGSGDSLRTAIGSSWQNLSSSTSGEMLVQNYKSSKSDPEERYISKVATPGLDDAASVLYSAETVQPIIKYPVRLYGNEDIIKSDEHWKSIVNGGDFGEQTYPGIFTDAEFSDHKFEYPVPYSVLEAREGERPFDLVDKIDVSYNYNQYMQAYEIYVSQINQETLIPNIYMLQTAAEIDETTTSDEQINVIYDRDIINSISRESVVPQATWATLLKTSTDFEARFELDPTSKKMANQEDLEQMRMYLSNDVVRNQLSGATAQALINKMQNILFDDMAMQREFVDTLKNKALMPYYTMISFEAQPGGPLVESIQRNDFSSKFLVSLKETFGREPAFTEPGNISYTIQETNNLELNKENNTVSALSLRTVDYGDLINQARTNYAAQSDNYVFVGRQDMLSRKAAKDITGVYRYINTIAATKTFGEYLDYVDDPSLLKNISEPHTAKEQTMLQIETVAYRVEKIGGLPTGDAQTQNVLQDFWFINTPSLFDRTSENVSVKDFQFMDSQVKYGEEYTYNVYAYVLVPGSRYQASDLRVTRVIANLTPTTSFGTPFAFAPLVSTTLSPGAGTSEYCLEFYEPSTGDTKPRLFIDEATSLATENPLITDAQLSSTDKYLADYNITVQPSLLLIEVPITTKTLSVLDNPANIASALPFHPEDDSQTIGFDIEYRAFEEKQFPNIVSNSDEVYMTNYLNSNNLLSNTALKNETVSNPRYLEIYRTAFKPLSYLDFEGNRKAIIDLKMHNSDQTCKDYVFYDKVSTNIKYYYMFRILNEHNNTSRPSLIYQAELINDGGYLYPIFDTLFIEDLMEDKNVNPSTSFKKLINLVPSLQQVLLDDTDADLNEDALSQISNIKVGYVDSSIFGRKFKIRLTSKKTGKKIDLNITYDLRSE
jgi:hypothetical protein